MLPFVAIQSNDRVECLWGNVPTWSEVRDDRTVDREEFRNLAQILCARGKRRGCFVVPIFVPMLLQNRS